MPVANRIIQAGTLGQRKAGRKRGMNRWEKEYALKLAGLIAARVVLWYGYEKTTLKLADDTRYTPDFTVIRADGVVCFVEIKGFRRDDAIVKFRVAAEMFPWANFIMLEKDKGGWNCIEDIGPSLGRGGT